MGRHLSIGAFYALLALIALHQPLFHAPAHVPGAEITDYYHFHWNYWWMRHAITHDLNLYLTDYVMAPFTSNLAYHTLTPFWFPLWAVLEPLTGTIRAMNAVFVAALTLNGMVFFAFLRMERVAVGLALVGGALVMLAPLMWVGVYWTNINLLNWFWLPGIVLLWRRVVTTQGLAWMIVLGVALWAMLLSDLQYAIFGASFIVPYGVWTLIRSASRLRLIALGTGAVILALASLWVAGPLPYLDDLDPTTLAPTPAERAQVVDFPLGWLWNTGHGGRDVSFGAVILPLVLVALVVGRRMPSRATLTPPRWFWLLVALPPLMLTPGTQVIYDTFHSIFDGMFRYPERFSIVAIMALATVALRSLSPLVREHRALRYVVPLVLLLLIALDSRLFRSLPLIPVPPEYAFYERTGAEDGDYVILEVPTGASSGEGIVGEREYSELQFYGITHGKRMVNGHISRAPIVHYWYMRTDDPLFAWLGGRRLLEPDAVEQRLTEIIPAYPVGYVVVHTDLIARFTGQRTVQEVVGYLNRLDDHLCAPVIEGDLVAYRTTWHPAGCDPRTPPQTDGTYRIDLGTEPDSAYLGWGWYFREEIVPGVDVRWTGAPHATDPDTREAQVFVDLPPADYTLTLSAQAFQQPVNLTIRMNGTPLDTVTVTPDTLQTINVEIPASALNNSGINTLTFYYNAVIPAGERDLAIMVDWITFTPSS